MASMSPSSPSSQLLDAPSEFIDAWKLGRVIDRDGAPVSGVSAAVLADLLEVHAAQTWGVLVWLFLFRITSVVATPTEESSPTTEPPSTASGPDAEDTSDGAPSGQAPQHGDASEAHD